MKRLAIVCALVMVSVCAAVNAAEKGKPSENAAMGETAKFIRDTVAAKAPVILDVSHSVWSYAELGYKEFKSARKIVDTLKAEGFDVKENAAGIKTAFVARYGSGKPVIGLMAEYDALPRVGQEAGVPVRTPTVGNTNGHGCGHNSLGAGSVGAAIAVKEYLKAKKCPGTIVLFGTPAEETGCGKVFMVRAGCFKDVDAVFAWHPSTGNSAAQSHNNAYYCVEFTFHGISAHAAGCPECGRSAVDACELMNVGTNYLREHVNSKVRIHYAWTNPGGPAPNVIYDEAAVRYFVRAPQITECRTLVDRVVKIAQGAALMTETTMDYRVLAGLNSLVINSVMAQTLSNALVEMGPPEFDAKDNALAARFLDGLGVTKETIAERAKAQNKSVEQYLAHLLPTAIVRYDKSATPGRGYASTDDSDVSWVVPVARLCMAIALPGTRGHSWEWTAQGGSSIGDKGTLAASRTLARACTIMFQKPELVTDAKKELMQKTGGKYICPIPKGINVDDIEKLF